MSEKFHYGIAADALDELDRLEYMAAFVSDAIGCIAESLDKGDSVTKKCWQGLYYLSEYMEERIAAIHSQCGEIDAPSIS